MTKRTNPALPNPAIEASEESFKRDAAIFFAIPKAEVDEAEAARPKRPSPKPTKQKGAA